jgi:hypothetical protein
MMRGKQINIPKYFQELHGEKTSLFSLILVYFTSFINSLILTHYAIPEDFALWKTILFFIIVLDIAGGVIANFTNSTNQYYQEKSNLRIPFISLHIIHPTILYLLFPSDGILFIFMGVYTIASCFILNFIHGRELQRLIAVFLVTMGATLVFVIPSDIPVLRLLPILFFLKLILGFSVKRLPDRD